MKTTPTRTTRNLCKLFKDAGVWYRCCCCCCWCGWCCSCVYKSDEHAIQIHLLTNANTSHDMTKDLKNESTETRNSKEWQGKKTRNWEKNKKSNKRVNIKIRQVQLILTHTNNSNFFCSKILVSHFFLVTV